jgi:predicted Abi (CAAX) family protease
VGRLLGISFYSQIKSAFRPAFVTGLFFIIALIADSFILAKGVPAIRGWILFGFCVSITLFIVFILAFYLGLSSQQRKNILQRFRMVLNITTD